MKRIALLFTVFIFITKHSVSQKNQVKNNSFKISGGKAFFGTGDIIGYAVQTEFSHNIIKTSRKLLNQLQIGSEFLFESGNITPKIDNPTAQEFYSETFYHTSNAVLTFKISYFPLGGCIIRGFNVAIGPSIGYSHQSRERQATGEPLPGGGAIRRSILEFNNDFLLGYKVSTGYEFYFAKKWMTGLRIDFSGYANGDINTFAGLKAGFRF
jgi:hypothetical protein